METMYDSILVPTDGSTEAQNAAEHGVDLAAELGATVHALYVVESRVTALPSDSMAQAAEHDEWKRYGEDVTDEVVAMADERRLEGVGAVRSGKAHEEIVDYAEEADVDAIVMGTQGRDGVGDVILGSVAERVVRTAGVPVLSIRQAKLE